MRHGMRVAAIDIGSNSLHMIVAQVEADGRFRVLDRAKEMVRLGQRTLTSGRLSADAMNAGIRTLAAFKKLGERHGVVRFKAVATSAVREAKNGGDFVQRVRDEVGLRVKVIPGREEARLVYLGVRHAIDLRAEPTLIVDAGGGSVEFIFTEDGRAVCFHSLKLGVTRLTERFLRDDPPGGKELDELDRYLGAQLEPVLERTGRRPIRRVVATSGTLLNVVTIAASLRGELPDGQLNNLAVSAGDIGRARRAVVKADRKERLNVRGLEARRVDLIVAGAALADFIMRHVDGREMVACTWALREGVLMDFIARHRRGIEEVQKFADPRRLSVARFSRHLGEMGDHAEHVARLALQLYDQLEGDLGLAPELRDWLEYAALLHDIGHHIGHKDHQRHSYYLITNGELLGFRREELEIIALTARYHRKGPPKDTDEGYRLLPRGDRRTVRALSALLRVADGLDRSHYGVVKDIAVQRRGDKLTLLLHTAGDDAALEVWEAERRTGLLAEELGVDVVLQVQDEVLHADRPAAAARHAQRA